MTNSDLLGWLPPHGRTLPLEEGEAIERILSNSYSAIWEGKKPPKELAYVGHTRQWGDFGDSRDPQGRRAQDHYQVLHEEELLHDKRQVVVDFLRKHRWIWEIGPGNYSKTMKILEWLGESDEQVIYIVNDISPELEGHVDKLAQLFPAPRYRIFGLHGSDQAALEFLSPRLTDPCTVLVLGTHFFNKSPDANEQLAPKWRPFFAKGHQLLVGQDGHGAEHKSMAEDSYRDFVVPFVWENARAGLIKRFGVDLLNPRDWECTNQLLTTGPAACHIIELTAKRDLNLGHKYAKGDKIRLFDSWKYRPEEVSRLCLLYGLKVAQLLQTPGTETYIYFAIPIEEPSAPRSKL